MAATKKQMLKGLTQLKKILLDAQRGKSKTRPPIDIKDKKGMEKVIKEIGKNNGGGFDEEFRELRERMKAEDRAKAKPTAQSRKEKFPNRKKPTGKFDLDLMQGTGALKKEDFPPKKEKKEKRKYVRKYRTSPKVVSPGKQKPTMTDEQVRAELEAKTKPRMGVLTGRRAKRTVRGNITKK